MVGESALDFSSAYGTCEKYNASLTTIDSKDEHDFVASLVPAQDLWISFNNREMKKHFDFDQHGKEWRGQSSKLVYWTVQARE